MKKLLIAIGLIADELQAKFSISELDLIDMRNKIPLVKEGDDILTVLPMELGHSKLVIGSVGEKFIELNKTFSAQERPIPREIAAGLELCLEFDKLFWVAIKIIFPEFGHMNYNIRAMSPDKFVLTRIKFPENDLFDVLKHYIN
jgi:hypothetical protein